MSDTRTNEPATTSPAATSPIASGPAASGPAGASPTPAGSRPVSPGSVPHPGLGDVAAERVIAIMQERLAALLDLHLTLKHVHWNVVGMNFISIHEMLDPQVDAVREMSDAVAERIASLGGEPEGTPGAIVRHRRWDDYGLNRQPAVRHLAALDSVYGGLITSHREAQREIGELDPISEDLFIGHIARLELFQWFVRAHLQDASGDVVFRNAERTAEAGGDGR